MLKRTASNFSNLIIDEIPERRYDGNTNDLLANETNKFKGFECWAGIEQISIESNGDVWRCVIRAGECLGNIYEGFEIPNDTILCPKEKCTCAGDLLISRALPDYRDKLSAVQLEKNE